MASPKGENLPSQDYYTTQELKFAKERAALVDRLIMSILTAGCIYTAGAWVLFLLTILFIQKVF